MIDHLEPKNVFKFFEEICNIPHGSYHTDLIADYVVDFAKQRNLECYRDNFNNVIIKKDATADCKSESTVIIQGHLDMVCAKDADVDIDMEKDGLLLGFDEKYIFAKGTTLGGDDGIAVAMMLAILDSATITHPELECVFTTDEEVGMTGATGLDMSVLSGKYLLNIDSEDEGEFTVSCAGGETLIATVPKLNSNKKFSNSIKILIRGLTGGHSGVEIDKGRANANILMGKLLKKISEKAEFELAFIEGGEKDNAIPTECYSVINTDDVNTVIDCIKETENEFKNQYFDVEKNLSVTSMLTDYISGFDSKIIDIISSVTNGIKSMSKDIEGLVQTSSNLGIIRTDENAITVDFSLRSCAEKEKSDLHNEIEKLIIINGGTVKSRGKYPAWEFNKNSELKNICIDAYEKQYGEKPKIVAIHAGLECGIFCSKSENLDCISYGPNILDIHTTKEKLEIESVKRVFEFTKNVLKMI